MFVVNVMKNVLLLWTQVPSAAPLEISTAMHDHIRQYHKMGGGQPTQFFGDKNSILGLQGHIEITEHINGSVVSTSVWAMFFEGFAKFYRGQSGWNYDHNPATLPNITKANAIVELAPEKVSFWPIES